VPLALFSLRSELCSSFPFVYPARSAVQFLSALSVAVAFVRPGIVLETSNQKARVFLVHIVFLRRFSEHAHNVFGEMLARL
jgi:hypothetical protein